MKQKTKLLSVLLTLTMGIAALGTMAGCGLFDDNKNSSSSSNTTPYNGNSSNANTDQDDPIPPTGTQELKYTLSDDKTYYSVTGYTGTPTTVYIPDTYEDLPVKEICYDAFYHCSSLTSVTIGNNVTIISDYAFSDCFNLTNITIDENNTEYKSIDGNLYSANEKKLIQYALGKTATKFTIPNGVIFIGNYAFRVCDSLEEIVIPDSVTSIGDSAFSNCLNLSEIVIPDSVISIGDYEFCDCDNLTSVTIENGVASIGDNAFYNCTSLTEIVIPNSVTSIGEHAFYGCRSLTIYCEATSKPSNWYHYNSQNYPVVWDCNNNDVADDNYIYTVKDGVRYALKDGVATVERQPKNINRANIPSSIIYKSIQYNILSIRDYAFSYCSSLTSVAIDNGITSISDSAFYDCDSLTEIVIPDSVITIGGSAFGYCDNLTSVTIGNSVTSIDNTAFEECSSLASVKFEDTSTWYVTDSYTNWNNKTGGTQVSVTDNDTNAMYFTDIYDYDYYWYKL